MSKHSHLQQIVFLSWINKLLDNDFVSLELRQRLKGQDLPTKKYIQELPTPNISKDKAKELLWTYVMKHPLRGDNLKAAISGVQIQIETQEDKQHLSDQLNEHLQSIELPTI